MNKPWIDAIHTRYIMGCDGMSLPLYILTMVITVLVIIYSWNHIPEPGNPKAFFILILILQVGMAGTFVAQDLILFFVFFEVVLLPMYFMIGVWGGEQRQLRLAQVLPVHAVRLGLHAARRSSPCSSRPGRRSARRLLHRVPDRAQQQPHPDHRAR